MKPCLPNYARTSKPQKGAANSASGSPLNTPSHTLATGKDDVHAIVACARISSICAAAPSSTICMSWLVPSCFRLNFPLLLDYLTDALGVTIQSLRVCSLTNRYQKEKKQPCK